VIWVIALGAACASALGLAAPGAFDASESPLRYAQFLGQNLVTLFVLVPGLIAAGAAAARGSLRGQLAQVGLLAAVFYTFATYALGATDSRVFLADVVLYAAALWALVVSVIRLDRRRLPDRFAPDTPARFIGGVCVTGGVLIAAAAIVQAAFAPLAPEALARAGSGSLAVQAMDLGLLAPVAIAGGLLLARRHPVGYVAAAIALVVLASVPLTLLAAEAQRLHYGAGVSTLAVLGLATAAVIATAALIRLLRGADHDPTDAPA
jgi:hypothetical protein